MLTQCTQRTGPTQAAVASTIASSVSLKGKKTAPFGTSSGKQFTAFLLASVILSRRERKGLMLFIFAEVLLKVRSWIRKVLCANSYTQ